MNKWRFVLVKNLREWNFGHHFVRSNSGRLILEGWCFGPLEWQKWFV